jgi:hypothetical protein
MLPPTVKQSTPNNQHRTMNTTQRRNLEAANAIAFHQAADESRPLPERLLRAGEALGLAEAAGHHERTSNAALLASVLTAQIQAAMRTQTKG